jgi:hypothetical protein
MTASSVQRGTITGMDEREQPATIGEPPLSWCPGCGRRVQPVRLQRADGTTLRAAGYHARGCGYDTLGGGGVLAFT